MATIISIIIGCLSIGIILSAPMGPIGIMCVQRTLSNGRLAGFYTGVGAAASDLLYCLLTGLGMSIVTDFIEANVSVLQAIGSILLIAYAIYMIVHNPVSIVEDNKPSGADHTRNAITGFFLTLSNPMIIFLIIPLFARFSFPMPEYHFYHIILGYTFIVLGALLWWFVITFAVDKVRAQFSINSMQTINRIVGSILLILSLYGLVTGTWDYLSQINLL